MFDPKYIDAENHFRNGNLELAEKKYSSFIDQSSNELAATDVVNKDLSDQLATALNNRGQIKYRKVEFAEAIKDYTLAIKHKQDFAVAFYNRGQIHYRLARFEEGISDFLRALEIQPDFPDCCLALQTAREDMEEKRERMREASVSS